MGIVGSKGLLLIAALSVFAIVGTAWAQESSSCLVQQKPLLPLSASDLQEILQCTPMKVGECRVVDQDSIGMNWGSTLHRQFGYSLCQDSRAGSGAFDVVVNPEFVKQSADGTPSDTPVSKDVDLKMRARFNQCFAAMGKWIRSEDGGQLHIRLADSSDNSHLPPRIPIAVVDHPLTMREQRSIFWSAETDCPTLIHETLHLLGMVDEYKEPGVSDAGGVEHFQCRKLGPADSIMRNMQKAVESVSGHYEELVCSCANPHDQSCFNKLQAMSDSDEQCPIGTKSNFVETPMISQFDVDTDAQSSSTYRERIFPVSSVHRLKVQKMGSPGDPAAVSLYKQALSITKPPSAVIAFNLKHNGEVLYDARMLECRCDDYKRCGSILKNVVAPIRSCPPGTIAKTYDQQVSPEQARNLVAGKKQGFLFEPTASVNITRYLPPKKDWLLYPAEFRAIAYPGCQAANHLFYACAKNAYLPYLLVKGSTCSPAPPECNDPQAWMK